MRRLGRECNSRRMSVPRGIVATLAGVFAGVLMVVCDTPSGARARAPVGALHQLRGPSGCVGEDFEGACVPSHGMDEPSGLAVSPDGRTSTSPLTPAGRWWGSTAGRRVGYANLRAGGVACPPAAMRDARSVVAWGHRRVTRSGTKGPRTWLSVQTAATLMSPRRISHRRDPPARPLPRSHETPPRGSSLNWRGRTDAWMPMEQPAARPRRACGSRGERSSMSRKLASHFLRRGDYVYLTTGWSLLVFARDPATGALTAVQCL